MPFFKAISSYLKCFFLQLWKLNVEHVSMDASTVSESPPRFNPAVFVFFSWTMDSFLCITQHRYSRYSRYLGKFGLGLASRRSGQSCSVNKMVQFSSCNCNSKRWCHRSEWSRPLRLCSFSAWHYFSYKLWNIIFHIWFLVKNHGTTSCDIV